MPYTDDDVRARSTVATNLHINTVSAEFAGDARHAAAMLMSGSGFLDAPWEVLQAFSQLLEAGYAQALRDVRDDKYDVDIAEWRPEPAGP